MLIFGVLLENYSPGRLIQVIQGAALTTLVLNLVALWKQEARDRQRKYAPQRDPTFSEAWQSLSASRSTKRALLGLALGTMAFTMEDVLLEPYGGEVLGMTVSATTYLTATLALGSLVGFGFASRALTRGSDANRLSSSGALIGLPAFVAVILAAPMQSTALFIAGTFLIGLGAGLFAHGTLTSAMRSAPKNQIGLALGTWGAVQATAAGVAMALGGVIRDAVRWVSPINEAGASWVQQPAFAYSVVYGIELVLLLVTVITMWPLAVKSKQATHSGRSMVSSQEG
jgi:BCD family chlorophyll transporter-like MFS transporter